MSPGNQSHGLTTVGGLLTRLSLLLHCAVRKAHNKLISYLCLVVVGKVNLSLYIDGIHTVTISEIVGKVLGVEASLEIGILLGPLFRNIR